MEPKSLKELLDSDRYSDRGGYKAAVQIFNGKLKYEDKMQEVKDTFKVSIGTAKDWYGKYRSMMKANEL